jgi:hypothetical protein
MRLSFLPIFVILAAAGCSGDGGADTPGAPTAPTPSGPTFRLTGSVRDGSALSVLNDVTVTVVGGANAGKSAVTGLDGQYVLSGLVRDAFVLRVSNGNYLDHLQDITLTQDTEIDVRLVPKRTLNSGWSQGRLFYTANGQREMARLVSAEVVHTGSSVSGMFATAEGGAGSFIGHIDGTTFTGRLNADFMLVSGSGSRCHGVAPTATGFMSGDVIEVRADAAAFENCAGAATVVELTIQP